MQKQSYLAILVASTLCLAMPLEAMAQLSSARAAREQERQRREQVWNQEVQNSQNLAKMVAEQQKTNALLEQLVAELKRQQAQNAQIQPNTATAPASVNNTNQKPLSPNQVPVRKVVIGKDGWPQ